MKLSKNGSSNKTIIYQMPLLDRILGILSSIILPCIPVLGLLIPLYNNTKEFLIIVSLLCAMILYCIFMVFYVFQTYLCLDTENHKFVIREAPGFKKREFDIKDIKKIEISDTVPQCNKNVFSIDIVFSSHIHSINSWSTGPRSLPIIGSDKMQRKRLEKFAQKCNEELNRYNL